MNDLRGDALGDIQLFFLMDASHNRLYKVIDLLSEYCEKIGCDECRFLNGVQCTIPAYIQGADEKELLWLLNEANVGWELYKIFPNDPLPQVSRIKKGENCEYKYGTV